ncbi:MULTISPECIES: hypothetical protein [unclassified Limnobacter]|jgi:hypothetical protein|uniref:hypothetical protein n=1 Tax=unclassified Limnobacter TaxID=2630203 RepID=UPI0011B08634|nr:hypothetical protein [Limnobacter sp. SAORIC-690]
MNSTLKAIFLQEALRLALRRPAPTRIPRTLPRAATIDCYVVTLSNSDEGWSMLIESRNDEMVAGSWLNKDRYDAEATLLPQALRKVEFEGTHFLGPYEFKYHSPVKFVVHQWLRLPYITVLRDRLEQFQFNRQHLVRMDRIAILRHVYEASLETPRREVSSITVAASIYSNRIFFHPDKNRMLNHCRLLLDSLVASGDLAATGTVYTLAPTALQTLSQYEEEERRHLDVLSQQCALKWFTFVLIAVGLLQAYITWMKP